MNRRAFLVPLAAAVAALMTSAGAASTTPLEKTANLGIHTGSSAGPDPRPLVLHRSTTDNTVAQHSSHASHGSHGSHGSHASHSSGR